VSQNGTEETPITPEKRQLLLDEYKEIGINWRYWGEVRFKQLTVFLSATGVLGAATLSTFSNIARQDGRAIIGWMLAILGVVITVLFFFLEERATYYRRAYMSCAKAIEARTGLSQYHRAYNPISVRSDEVMRFFFATFAALWVAYSALTVLGSAWALLFVGLAIPLQKLAARWGRRYQEQAAVAGVAPIPDESLLRAARSRDVHDDQPDRGSDAGRPESGEEGDV
jgi:hypothetical protein